jgi:hypothetical protein
MQRLSVNDPGLPDLQFVLMVLALCTSGLDSLNLPESLRQSIFHRCWALLHGEPPPANTQEQILDLRQSDELALQAIVEVIRNSLSEHGITQLTWEHPPSEPTRSTTPEALPLIQRLQELYPPPPDIADNPRLGP